MVSKEPSERPGVQTLRLRGLPFIVLIISLIATAATTYGFYRATSDRDSSRFENAVQATQDRIGSRLETYVAVLFATRGLFAGSEYVSRDEFHAFVQQLELEKRYPGVEGIGFSRRFSSDQRQDLEAEMRNQGYRNFRVWPAGNRKEMYTIVYMEPRSRQSREAIGFDMATEDVRLAAMHRARDTGRPAATGGIRLIEETDNDKQAGFNIYVPVYSGTELPTTVEERRETLVGFVYSAFRMGDLLRGVADRRVAFAVYDGEDLLHQSRGYTEDAAFATSTKIDVAGRTWVLMHRSLPYFEQGSSRGLWGFVLGVGVFVSALLFFLSRTQARAQQQLRLHARIVESMSEGVSVTDKLGRIVYTNQAEDEMFGYGPGELIGRNVAVQEANPPEAQERVNDQIAEAVREQRGWSGELPNRRKDGTTFVTGARITALRRDGQQFWVRVQEDITERKRAEEERLILLGREKTLRAQAEDASRTKDEFLAMLGHELRNPLAPIVTALELIKMRGNGVKTPELGVIERQVQHLERLIEDLLDVSRITRGKVSLDRRRMELAKAVCMATELVTPLIEERKHTLTIDVPRTGLVVKADDARIAQVIANLLTNSARYTEPGGHIVVSASRENGDVVLRVRDDGIGIPPEDIPSLFELFTQGNRAVDRAQGGLGIGLTLVRSLVELHGGQVEAHSEGPGHGSEFTVRLPAAPAAAEEVTAEPPAAEPARSVPTRRRILVVDDNVDAADLLAEYLRAAGHEVGVAYDGHEALALAPELHPDAAILDIGLPTMDGYELAARLLETAPMTLVALTGYGQQQDRDRSAAVGFEYHFVKPLAPAKLLAVLSESPPPGEKPGHEQAPAETHAL